MIHPPRGRSLPGSARDSQLPGRFDVENRLVSVVGSILAVCALIATSGCSEELGPETMPVAQVNGSVTENGRALAQGWVEFFPVDGTIGNLRSSRIHPDGSFQADGVAVGRNLVRLVNADIKTPGLSRVFSSYQSPIRRIIAAEPSGPITIDLVTEAIQIQNPRARPAGSSSTTAGSGESR